MHTNDFKLFLANKKKERDQKLKDQTLRGKEIVDIQEKPPSIVRDSATLACPIPPNSLLPSAHGTRSTRFTALSTARPDGDQNTSAAVTGIQDMSGDL